MTRKEREVAGIFAFAITIIVGVAVAVGLASITQLHSADNSADRAVKAAHAAIKRLDGAEVQTCERVRLERHRLNEALYGQWKTERRTAVRLERAGRRQLTRARVMMRSPSASTRAASAHVHNDGALNLKIAAELRAGALRLTYSTQTNCRDAVENPDSYLRPTLHAFPLPQGVPLP